MLTFCDIIYPIPHVIIEKLIGISRLRVPTAEGDQGMHSVLQYIKPLRPYELIKSRIPGGRGCGILRIYHIE